ncbi:unnamed protein product [Cylindrotheca closterium]|uniref:NADP-dependent oxidoreductase domain-containing protein n=1 Tax=Cylindrotheca closterium TaxID=2856 RepID=A0AAD2CJ12_9STRA|nr:unnamed protein product [Cylindrotheca closterium]
MNRKPSFLGRSVFTILSTWSLFHNAIVSADLPTTKLSNGIDFPLVGLGVGNLQHELIESQISHGLSTKMNYRMLDTAHASHNENIIHTGIEQGLSSYAASLQDSTDGANSTVHVITKVWYTHLGYERTKISVKESLEQLNSPNISVHLLIHWPRCRDDVPWMDCEAEENLLPQYVKDAGPPPHLDKDHAYLESWRALEDIYMGKVKLGTDLPLITSIGISNFDLPEIKELIVHSRIVPHMMQGNSWSYVFDPDLIYFLYRRKIHFQVYNVMNGIYERSGETPLAFRALGDIARALSAFAKTEHGRDIRYTEAQILLKWFTQNKVSVIPRTRSLDHLEENSPEAVGSMPHLTPEEEEQVSAIVRSMFEGHDFDQPQASFINAASEKVHLFWKDLDGMEHPVRTDLEDGDVFDTATHTGHVFVAYDDSQLKRKEFQVTATYNQVEEIHIGELLEEL